MTDTLICPFCGEPLYPDSNEEFDYLTCENFYCDASIYMRTDTWQQIIAWKQSATVLKKKLDRLTIAANRCLNKFAHERIHAELKAALKEIEDIKE